MPKPRTGKRRGAPKRNTGRGRRTPPAATKVALERLVRRLERRVAAPTAALAALRADHQRRLAGVRRAADRKLAGVVRELAALRHHEARATALERILAERNAMERRDDGETASPTG